MACPPAARRAAGRSGTSGPRPPPRCSCTGAARGASGAAGTELINKIIIVWQEANVKKMNQSLLMPVISPGRMSGMSSSARGSSGSWTTPRSRSVSGPAAAPSSARAAAEEGEAPDDGWRWIASSVAPCSATTF